MKDLNSTLYNVYAIESAKIDRRDRREQNRRHSRQPIVHGWKASHVRFSPYRRAVSFATRAVVARLAIAASSVNV